jgi:hypothetical protein
MEMEAKKLKFLKRWVLNQPFLCEIPTNIGLLVYTPEDFKPGFDGRVHITGTVESFNPEVSYPGLKILPNRDIFDYLESVIVNYLHQKKKPSFYFSDKISSNGDKNL